MEDYSQENLTTRSLLKGILATEIVCPAVKHQTKWSISRASVSRIHQDKTPASPSMTLRSQMKSRVRRSIGKLALEDSYVKRNVKTKKKPAIKEFNNIVEELNNITPQSLLRRIIQNEDEVSIIISQRSKTAVDRTEQEGACETEQSSLCNVNLSLPDQEDTETLDVFRATHKKRRMSISQFEREMDEKLPKNRDNSSSLKENIEDLMPLVNTNMKTRYFGDRLDFSIDPQSTYKRALLRKPNKAFLVSLGDFEQGVENKYHLIKGSQECFIESTVEDKSTISTRGVAELNTELYVPPLLSESNTLGSENRLVSNSLVSSDKQEKGRDMSLRKRGKNLSISVSPKAMFQGTHTTEMMEESTKSSETISNISKSVPMGENVEHSTANESIQKSLLAGEEANEFESDQNIYKSVSVVKNIGHFGSKQDRGTRKSGSMIKDSERKSIENSVLRLGNARPLQLHQSISKSLLTDKDGSPIKPSSRMQKSELVDGNDGPIETNVNKEGEMMETADIAIAEHEPLQTILAETGREPEGDRLSRKINYSAFNKENGNKYTKSLNISSRQEDDSESSQGHNSEDLLQTESTMEGDVISPEYQAKINKQSMISALIETPAYIRNARLKFPPNKLVAGKNVHKKATLRTKKDSSPFKSSLVKQLFTLHAKMRMSKEASTDVENFLEMFLDQMTGDLAAYAAHANRKTITLADVELLMKRQRLVTDASSFNVLIERHLPLECRKLLISCAMSGNKVFPKM